MTNSELGKLTSLIKEDNVFNICIGKIISEFIIMYSEIKKKL